MITTIFVLLVAFQLKHFASDYLLQNKYMLGKFKPQGWVEPLASHCGVHMAFSFFIGWAATHSFAFGVGLGFLDFLLHFLMDKWKVEMSRNLTYNQPKFWWALGFDQMFHHLTHYGLIALIVARIN